MQAGLQPYASRAVTLCDARFFRQEREAVGNRYPFDRAERFLRDVRKLGVSEAGPGRTGLSDPLEWPA